MTDRKGVGVRANSGAKTRMGRGENWGCLKSGEKTVWHEHALWLAGAQACGGTINEVAVGARLRGPSHVRLTASHWIMSVNQYNSKEAPDYGGQLKVFVGEGRWAEGKAAQERGAWAAWPFPPSLPSLFTLYFRLRRTAAMSCHIWYSLKDFT